MDIEKMTEQLQQIIMAALTKAQTSRNPELTAEHILQAMIEDNGLDGIWQRVNADKNELMAFAESYVNRLPSTNDSTGQPLLSRYVTEAYTRALDYMKKKGDTYMSSAAYLIGLMNTNSEAVKQMMRTFRFTAKDVEKAEDERRGGMRMDEKTNEGQLDALSKYGHDLVQDVKDGRIDPVIGRDEEIRRVIEILSRKTKNNPVLIGEPGVGKTAIVEGQIGRAHV